MTTTGQFSIGSKVQVMLLDADEGLPTNYLSGTISFDWEELYYRREVSVNLDNGKHIIVPKWYLSSINEEETSQRNN